MYAAGQAIAIRQARKHVKKQPSGEQSHPSVRPTPGSGERFPRFPQQLHPKHHGAHGDHHPFHHHNQHHHPPYGGRGPHINGKISWQGVTAEVRDASSGEYSHYGGFRAGGAATALLYVGLGTVAVGLVISFVGLGEKGFKTLELRMIGPGLIVGGLLLCLLRIFLCTCCPPPFPPPPCCLHKNLGFSCWRERPGSRHPQPTGKCHREGKDEEAAASQYGFEEASLLKGKRKKVSPEALPATSSSRGFGGAAGGEGERKASRHAPGPLLPPVALHLQQRVVVPPAATQSGSGRTPPTHLPNQVVGDSDDDDKRDAKGGVARGRTNKVWSEVAGVPPEGRWVAPEYPRVEGDKRSRRRRTRSSGGAREAGGEGHSALASGGEGLANPDPEAHRVEGGEFHRPSRGSAGPSRRTPERRRAQRQYSSRTENELVLSPATLEGL